MKKDRITTKGWVPDQHGAWVMVTVPLLLGSGLSRPGWLHALLAVAWFFGYFAFFAAGWWLRVRGRKRAAYLPAMMAYGSVSALATVAVVCLRPELLVWGAAFAPLVAVAVWEAYRRRPRSLISGLATVLASNLMFPVAWQLGGGDLSGVVWARTAVLAAYFCGTIFVVKTLIRERRNQSFWKWSYLYHVIALVGVAVLAAQHLVHWGAVPVFSLLFLRSVVVPHLSMRRATPLSPKTVGVLEMVCTLIVSWITVVGLP
ncbi:YwiC-like family protein [Staphylococcus chromogenes]|nr:YwiC-like family protein [Staphylococcus chromogenes]